MSLCGQHLICEAENNSSHYFYLYFNSQQGKGFFFFYHCIQIGTGDHPPTHPPIKWVQGVPSMGIKQLEHQADHSLPSSVKVKNAWSYTSNPPVCLHGMMFN